MTGYGKKEKEIDGLYYNVEIRSVNHRYQDITIKLPKFLMSLEEKIKKEVQEILQRGKIEVNINFKETKQKFTFIDVNWPVLNSYFLALESIRDKLGIEQKVTIHDLLNFNDIIQTNEKIDLSVIANELLPLVEGAAKEVEQMRINEGKSLAKDIIEKINNIDLFFQNIISKAIELPREYKQKLELRLKELLTNDIIDKERLAQEVAILADKSSIDEEIIRFKSHIQQAKNMIQYNEPVGRKFDFLIQEMNREINTIGAKANDLLIIQTVIEIKSELEKLREQVQNIV